MKGFRVAMYKGTRPGLPGIYNRLVRWWTRSPYSHCELVFSTGHAASASFMDKGVQIRVIDFDPKRWDFIALPKDLEKTAFEWFEAHRNQPYDVLGNVQFIVARVADDKRKWFCSESIAAALGLADPWRYDPATLASVLPRLAPAG